MTIRSPRARELTVAIGDPAELFEPSQCDVAEGLPPGDPGIERIRHALENGSLRAPVGVTIELPPDQVTPELERGIRQAVQRYCDHGIARAGEELRAIMRDGMQTMVLGALLLAGFLLVSEAILRSGAPSEVREFFGNGLFLVAAWVGMWYPLDTLIYSGRPHRIERRLLRALRSAEIRVRTAPATRSNMH
jgi:hypothetical protein